jgi:hypothetical protein
MSKTSTSDSAPDSEKQQAQPENKLSSCACIFLHRLSEAALYIAFKKMFFVARALALAGK